jgi:hypothetical protein
MMMHEDRLPCSLRRASARSRKDAFFRRFGFDRECPSAQSEPQLPLASDCGIANKGIGVSKVVRTFAKPKLTLTLRGLFAPNLVAHRAYADLSFLHDSPNDHLAL